MKRFLITAGKTALLALLSCLCATAAFGQANNATLTGTALDSSGAVLPGVSIRATNGATGVVTSAVTNEAGVYNILGLIPGTYTVSGTLPGFQTQTFQDVVLGNAVSVRINFSLKLADLNTSVEVTVAADTVLQTSSPTIGQVLPQKKVQELPIVGNNVLDLLTLLGGLDNYVMTGAPGQSAFGREGAMVIEALTPSGVAVNGRNRLVCTLNPGDEIRVGPAIIVVEQNQKGSPFTLRFRMAEQEGSRLDRLHVLSLSDSGLSKRFWSLMLASGVAAIFLLVPMAAALYQPLRPLLRASAIAPNDAVRAMMT